MGASERPVVHEPITTHVQHQFTEKFQFNTNRRDSFTKNANPHLISETRRLKA